MPYSEKNFKVFQIETIDLDDQVNDLSTDTDNNQDPIVTQLRAEVLQLKTKVDALQKKRKSQRKKIKNLKKENKKYIAKIKRHEKNMRDLFELYSKDKEEIFKQQLLSEKLKQEINGLEIEKEKQERRYENLKNQLSYRLGSRLVGMRKSKDILTFPKNLLEDYVAVRNKIDNNSNALFNKQKKPKKYPSSIYLNSRQRVVFDKSATLPLSDKFNTVMFNSNFRGSLNMQLYGVKPSASVDIELKIHALSADCVFRIMPDFEQVHHLSANETMTVNLTVKDNEAYQFMSFISSSGIVEVVFKKTRGVPSFINIYQDEKGSQTTDGFGLGKERTGLLDAQQAISIPILQKKSNLFREAWMINESQGFEMAKLFVEKYATPDTLDTLHIIEANNHLDDDQKWLSAINKYIASYGMESLQLKKGEEDKYYRLTSNVTYTIEDPIKISVIMPAYNSEKTIEMAMRSILNQTWQNLELIVVNDFSSDHTFDIIQQIASSDDRVKVINNPCNVGAYVSKNLGLKMTTGDYITGHDADDWAHPQRLEQHIRLIQSENKPPRASNTRMIRMEESGFLPLYPFGEFCHDGVMRIASITCMFETNFLKNILGGWDCSRFGADSEIISRCKMVIGDEFKNYELLSMICLDEPTSLTNHPLHGISKITGISPSRKFYKDQWTRWHTTLKPSNVYLPFPHIDRKFLVPEGTEIPEQNILKAIENVNKQEL